MSTITANSSIHIRNPYNPEYDAAIIDCEMVITLILEVQANFNLTGRVSEIGINVTNVQTFFKTDQDIEAVNKSMEHIKEPFQNKINRLLRRGFKLPLPERLFSDIS